MALRVTSGPGDILTGANFVGGVAPSGADSVQIAGHAMTYSADLAFGASGVAGTIALQIDSGGSLTPTTTGLKLTHRGDIALPGGALYIGAGGQLIHDSSSAAAPSTTHYGYAPSSGGRIYFQSTLAQPCKWTVAPGSGTAGPYKHPSGFGAYPVGDYVECLNLWAGGTAFLDGMQLDATNQVRRNWILENCGQFEAGNLDVSAAGSIEWVQLVIINPQGTFCNSEPYTAGATSAKWKLTDCVWDGKLQTANPAGTEWYHCAALAFPAWTGSSTKRRRFERIVMIVQNAEGNSGMVYEGDIIDLLHVIEDESATHNPHWGGANPNYDQSFARIKFEFGGGASAGGDGLTFGPTDYGGHNYTIDNLIGPSGSGDFSVGKLINVQSAQNLNITRIDHCTQFGDFTQSGECALIEYGETVSFRATCIAQATNSLTISPTANGAIIVGRVVDTVWQNVVTAANLHHNGTVNGKSSAEGTGLVQEAAGSNLFTVGGANSGGLHLTGTPGQTVVDHTRNLKSWAASLGYAATYAGAKAALLACYEDRKSVV